MPVTARPKGDLYRTLTSTKINIHFSVLLGAPVFPPVDPTTTVQFIPERQAGSKTLTFLISRGPWVRDPPYVAAHYNPVFL